MTKEYPPPTWLLSKQWGTRAAFRAYGGLKFLRECLRKIHTGGTDAAFSRSIYLLLSYNVELLLSAYLLLQDNHGAKTPEELMRLLTAKGNHNFGHLRDEIGKEKLRELGIKSITLSGSGVTKSATIALLNGEGFVVEDLVEVRYDYKYPEKRPLNLNESAELAQAVEKLISMAEKILTLIPQK